MTNATLYVFPHAEHTHRSRLGLRSATPQEELERALATVLVALDASLIGEDVAPLLIAAPALAELGHGEVVDAPAGVAATEIDLCDLWERLATELANAEPARVLAVEKALFQACHLADVPALAKHLPDVVAAYKPQAEFAEMLWAAIEALPEQLGDAAAESWLVDCSGEGVVLRCDVPEEQQDVATWEALGGDDLLAAVANAYPKLALDAAGNEAPHYGGICFDVGPAADCGMVPCK